jgi:hypothetical protein
MIPNHRSIYVSDIGLFLVLATPWLNETVMAFLLNFGDSSFYTGAARTSLTSFIGIAGVLGLGFSAMRLRIADSRDIVIISSLVKIASAAWLFMMFLKSVSIAFLLLAGADITAAMILILALRNR